VRALHSPPSPGRYPTHQPVRLSQSIEETLANHSEPSALDMTRLRTQRATPSGNKNGNHIPCLTLSSDNISKWLNSTFFSLSNALIFRENPQRGSSGLPFMNKTTLVWFINSRSLAFSSSGDSFLSLSWSADGTTLDAFAGDWSVHESGVYAGATACLATACVRVAASAPGIRAKRVWPYVVAAGEF